MAGNLTAGGRLPRDVPGVGHQACFEFADQASNISRVAETSSKYVTVSGKRMRVRANLYAFLHRFITSERTPHAQQQLPFLWIDALCIDQDNIKERNHQVAQMKAIYGQATEVLIWLGEPAPKHLASVEKAVMLCRRIEETRSVPWPRSDLPSIYALDGLIYMAYWSRIWIIQEILLSNTARILCAGHLLPFQTFEKAMKWLYAVHDGHVYEPSGERRQHEVAHLEASSAWGIANLYGKQFRTSLFALLRIFQQSKASEPRDKVFGLLGIASDSKNVTVDYGAPISNALLTAISTTTWQDFSSEQFDHLCTMMGVDDIAAHMVLDLGDDLKSSNSGVRITQLEEMRKHIQSLQHCQGAWARAVHASDLVAWSCTGRVRCCMCPVCEPRLYLIRDRHLAPKVLHVQSGIKTCISRWSDDPGAPTNEQAIVITMLSLAPKTLSYQATAVFVSGHPQTGRRLLPMPHECGDEELPVLLLYWDPDMSDTIEAMKHGKKWPRQYHLLQSCRMLAHLLPSRHSANASYDGIKAVGVQQMDFMAGEDVLLHGYIHRSDRKQYNMSSFEENDKLDPDELLRLNSSGWL